MPIVQFPPIDKADENGLLALGGDLAPESLLLAYSQGIFPWPLGDDYPMAWFSPDPRGVLLLKNFHIPRSLIKFMKKSHYKVTFNQDFLGVMRGCQELTNRKDQSDTWITEEIIEGYYNLFKEGYAYSVECYDNEELVGGLYGVCINSFFSGESMFFRKENASKVVLVKLFEKFQDMGVPMLDTQMVTSVVKAMGGEEIKRKDYIKLLQSALSQEPTHLLSQDQ
ncbi:leucyltransferase [Bacteriovorax sp. BSW11_IV]|uniref:leucyl/phenylalanyl-tRNA--protein transferase n=1 Tax=Bacteriovorax sp. BSW11_IV TaxID=1353529 RepID=UPI00038A2C6D|nr:leucyl/phenylalanyl-tRNA--protein transferase [Bacteriovorax sp. BSW11_IV]EQC44465.1 leucyltransferase [Bacteriovorax sp. BSW11_IV]